MNPVSTATSRPTRPETTPAGASHAQAGASLVLPASDKQAPPTAGAVASAAPAEVLQGTSLSLARILGRIVTALDLLTGDDGLRAISVPPGTEPTAESLHAVREELRLAREELTPLQGTGDALLSSAGRDAKSQQRTDPSHAPHFGG